MQKKKLIKIAAIAMAAATVTAFAGVSVSAHTVTDTWTGTSETAATTLKKITVKEVKDTSTELSVVAYQLVKGDYSDGKLVKYVVCDSNIQIADMASPEASEVITIAQQIRNNNVNLKGITMARNASTATTFEAEVEAGLYLVLVTGSDEVVYNPAIVAVNINDSNNPSDAVGGEVDMTKYFNDDDTAYLKASASGFDKKLVATDSDTLETNYGSSVAVGDTVKFALSEMTIPYYNDAYVTSSLKYEIADCLEENAFTGIAAAPVVKVDSKEVSADTATYTITYYEKSDFSDTGVTDRADGKTYMAYKITFAPAYIKANGGKNVEVTYQSTIAETAGVNFAENKNTATLTYSNDPSEASSAKTKKKNTYNYTFAIGGKIDGENQDTEHKYDKKITNEVNKVTKSNDWEETEETISGKKSKSPLAGAVFGLYSDAGFTTEIASCTTEADGIIKFSGLDAGTYYLKETTSPENYTLNDNLYKVVITPTFREDGVMTSYKVDVSCKTKTDTDYAAANEISYSATPAVDTEGNVNYSSLSTSGPLTEIINTNLAVLPSTGGAGTVALVVAGAVGMAFFLTLLVVVNRKKGKKNEEK